MPSNRLELAPHRAAIELSTSVLGIGAKLHLLSSCVLVFLLDQITLLHRVHLLRDEVASILDALVLLVELPRWRTLVLLVHH